MQPSVLYLSLSLFAATVVQADEIKEIKEIVVFSESISDTGNVADLQCIDQYPYVTPAPPDTPLPWAPCASGLTNDQGIVLIPPISLAGEGLYFDGNLSNGPVWVEYLADLLGEGVPRPEPSRLGGTNYAYAGAKSGYSNYRISLATGAVGGSEVRGLLGQIEDYLTTHKKFKDKQLITLWIGANDLRDAQGQGDIEAILENYGTAITTVACNGGKSIMIPNQLNASVAPAVQLSGADPAQVEQAIRAFNFGLRLLVRDLKQALPEICGAEAELLYVNAFAVGELVVNKPLLFGFKPLDEGDPSANFALDLISGQVVVENPDEYVFWDPIHPTTQFHKILAQAFYWRLVSAFDMDD